MVRFLLALTVLIISPPAYAALDSQCVTGEQIFFTCTLEDGRVISLCADPALTPQNGYMQFRVGAPGKIEYKYPETPNNTAAKNFTWKTEGEEFVVGFLDYDTQYEIFWTPGDEEGEAGLAFKGWGEVRTSCRKPFLSSVETLNALLPAAGE